MLETPKEPIDGRQNCKNLEDKSNKIYDQKDFRYRILKRQFDKFTERISQISKKEREMNYMKNNVPNFIYLCSAKLMKCLENLVQNMNFKYNASIN